MTNNIKLQLRLPDELHERLRRSASRHDRSLNGQILTFLRTSVADDERAAGRRPRDAEPVVVTASAPAPAPVEAVTPTPEVAGTNGSTAVQPVAAPRPRRQRRALAAAAS